VCPARGCAILRANVFSHQLLICLSLSKHLAGNPAFTTFEVSYVRFIIADNLVVLASLTGGIRLSQCSWFLVSRRHGYSPISGIIMYSPSRTGRSPFALVHLNDWLAFGVKRRSCRLFL